jgi:hypothetical protein
MFSGRLSSGSRRTYLDIKVEIASDYGLTGIVAERFDAESAPRNGRKRHDGRAGLGPTWRKAVVGAPCHFAAHELLRRRRDVTAHSINLRLRLMAVLTPGALRRPGATSTHA